MNDEYKGIPIVVDESLGDDCIYIEGADGKGNPIVMIFRLNPANGKFEPVRIS